MKLFNPSAEAPDLTPGEMDQLKLAGTNGLAANAKLLPEPMCAAVVAGCPDLSARSDPAEAAKSVRLLVGAYPVLKVTDPDVYVAMLTEAFIDIPAALHPWVIKALSNKFRSPPAKADVVAMGNQLKGELRKTLDGARRSLEEYKRRRTEANERAKRERDSAEIRARFGSKEAYVDHILEAFRSTTNRDGGGEG